MSNRYKGGVISATPPTLVAGAGASGTWTLEQQMQATAAGLWPVNGPFYIEDVFSTWLYTGNGSTQTITNGIDLAGKGGLVWLKNRSINQSHGLFNTTSGASTFLQSNATDGNYADGGTNSFTSTGFSLSASSFFNANTNNFASWTFREQPKFFDVVTWTGNGVAGRQIPHNLGSVPGCIIVKSTDNAVGWAVYHRSLGATKYMTLNLTDAEATNPNYWNDTEPTSTAFTVAGTFSTNRSGYNYVAYVFAHNAGGFGLTGTDNVISCGSFTTNSSAQATVNLGYEPQWLLIKRTDSSTGGDWQMMDVMRGNGSADGNVGNQVRLFANTSAAEGSLTFGYGQPTATGFYVSGQTAVNATYIYIAIRRGPMKVPTTGTSVFDAETSSGATGTVITTGFPVDLQIARYNPGGANNNRVFDRLRGVVTNTDTSGNSQQLVTNSTIAESTAASSTLGWNNTGFQMPAGFSDVLNVFWNFRRAPGFFDEVCYTGTGSAQNVTHNLTVAPELTIIKRRSGTGQNWVIGVGNTTNGLNFNTDPYFTYTGFSVTSTTFAATTDMSGSGQTYVAYLFASCPGVSKVGSYTGTDSTQVINCGFASGARFVLIKATSTTGNWLIWDSARGIVSGNDPYLTLNSNAAEVTGTDWVDTAATGFELSNASGNSANTNGVSYIFLAIA